jgi:hypothetical protein
VEWLVHTLRQYPELAIFLTLGLGYFVGKQKFGKFSLGGVTGTLLAGVLIGQLHITISPNVKVLDSTEATIPTLESQLRQTQNALCILMGMPPSGLKDLLGSESDIPAPPPQVAIGIPADLLRRRPHIKSAEWRAAAQCAQIGVAKASLYPAFSLTGTFGVQASDVGKFALDDMFKWSSRTDISVLIMVPPGINPTMLGRLPVYPNTAYGAAVYFAPTKNLYASYGIFDGNVARGIDLDLLNNRSIPSIVLNISVEANS